MPCEPFRFLHAANLRLGHPICGVPEALGEVLPIVEEATLTAFERTVEACLERQVDFLLITGHCFDPRHRTLRAEVALVRGLERLVGEGISIFIADPDFDLDEDWWLGRKLPDAISLLGRHRSEVLEIEREAQVLATISVVELPDLSLEPAAYVDGAAAVQGRNRLADIASTPFSIGVVWPAREGVAFSGLRLPAIETEQPDFTLDQGSPDSDELSTRRATRYYAVADVERRTEHTGDVLLHSPGSPQGVDPDELGPHGCTLVEVADCGTVTLSLVRTAAVRREWREIAIDAAQSRESLLANLQTILRGIESAAPEQVLIVQWIAEGAGPLFDAMGDDEFREQVWEELGQSVELPDVSHWASRADLTTPDAVLQAIAADNRLATRYVERLAELSRSAERLAGGTLAERTAAASPWEQRVRALQQSLDQHEALAGALRWGISRFGGQNQETR